MDREQNTQERSGAEARKESSELWTEPVTRAAEPTAAAGQHQNTWAVLHSSGCSQGNFNKNKRHKMQEGRRKNKGSCQSIKVTELVIFSLWLWICPGEEEVRLEEGYKSPQAPWLRKSLQQITREHMQRLPGKENREVMTLRHSTGIV